MAREKRKLYPEKSSRPTWPWLLGGLVLVLLITGIGLGVMLSNRLKADSGSTGTIAKVEQQGQKEKIGDNPAENGAKEAAGLNTLLGGTGGKAKPPAPAKANPKLYEFIEQSRVYLMPTKAGQLGIPSNHSELKEDSPLGTFFKAIKEHNKANFQKKENPDPFEAATYAEGPDPMKLKGDSPIRYDSAGGTPAKPVQYDLGPMAVLASALNPASKPAGIYFQFPEQRLWIHIKGIESIYLVPVEENRYPAPFILKVAQGVVFDDGSMTARVDSGITGAMKKLLKDNKASTKIMLRAGAPLATWGLAHENTAATIDFRKLHVEPQIAAAKAKLKHLNHFSTWTDNALENLFPAAERVRNARATAGVNRTDLQELEKLRQIKDVQDKKARALLNKFGINTPQKYAYYFKGKKDLIYIDEKRDLYLNRAHDQLFTSKPGGQNISAQVKFQNDLRTYCRARANWENKSKEVDRRNQELLGKQAALKKQQAAYAQIIALYSRAGSPVPGLDAHKSSLAKEAAQIFLGKSSAANANKKWVERKKNIPKDAKDEADKWNAEKHQKAEWERFKQHQVFYLGGTIGMGGQEIVVLVQFNQ